MVAAAWSARGEFSPSAFSLDMIESAARQDDFPHSFEAAFARFQILIEEACMAQPSWPLKVAAAIRAGLGFAVADPASAQLLTNDALAAGPEGIVRYERLIAYLREGLARGREEGPEAERLPDVTEHAVTSGVVMLVAQRVDAGKAAELPALVPEAIQFVLTPYLGAEEARWVANRPAADSAS
jgi:hypothetical protein